MLKFSYGFSTHLASKTHLGKKCKIISWKPLRHKKVGEKVDAISNRFWLHCTAAAAAGGINWATCQKGWRGAKCFCQTKSLTRRGQGCTNGGGRGGRCPPRFWQIIRRRQAAAARRITTGPPGFLTLVASLLHRTNLRWRFCSIL